MGSSQKNFVSLQASQVVKIPSRFRLRSLNEQIPSATQAYEQRMEEIGLFKILLPVGAKVEENLVSATSDQSVLENVPTSHWLVRFIEDMITQR